MKPRPLEYGPWCNMRRRCYEPTHEKFSFYGGRGVTFCERWLSSFKNFLADVGPRPSSKHSLDRYPNPNGNYEPGNVRWATSREQNRNRRDNRTLTYDGNTFTVAEWAERLQIGWDTLWARIAVYGWSDERAITEPVHTTPNSKI